MKNYSIAAKPLSAKRQEYAQQPNYRSRKLPSCIAFALAGASIITAFDAEAAETRKKTKKAAKSEQTINELQSQLERANQELAEAKALLRKNALSAASAVPGGSVPPAPAVGAKPATEIAQAEAAEPKEEKAKDLREVVVRSRPKLEKLHDVAQSASVVSGKELDRELSLDLGAVTRRASNVQFNQNNTRGASLSIRGLGKRSFSETQDPSVGVTLDGVSYGLTQLANFDFYDVESVEVTRGPRGTEGGLSASTGKVNITSKAPTFTPTAELSTTYGQREALIVKGALGGGLIDNLLAWRGSFIVDQGRGFYTNINDPNYTLYNKNRLSGRIQLLFTPTDSFTAKLSADFEPRQPQLQNGLTFFHATPFRYANGSLVDPNGTSAQAKLAGFTNNAGVFTGPRAYFQNRGFGWNDYTAGITNQTVRFNENQGQTVSLQGSSLQLDWDVGSHVLSSNTGVRAYSFDAHNDEGTPYDISVDGGGGVFYDQWTQEFKIRNKPGGFADYKAGFFGMLTNDNVESKAGWGSDAGAWFASNAQYLALDTNNTANRGAGLALLKDSLQDARTLATTRIRTTSGSLFGEADLHFTDAFTLTPGIRVAHENRQTEDDAFLKANGAGGALNPVAVNNQQLGGFNSNASGVLGANSAAQLALADSVANRYFGSTVTATAGEAYNNLTAAQKTLVATAKAIRANQIGVLYQPVVGRYNDLLYTAQVTPSYKINDDLTTYLSWQYGEKSGSAVNVNGISSIVKPEETHAIELGLKSFWLNKDLILNTDAYFMDVHNYQQTVQVVNQYQTALNIAAGQSNPLAYTAAQGNVNRVQVYGLELDSTYNGIQNLSLRLNGAYNIAQYVDYKNAARPEELGFLPTNYVNFSGATLPGASKWTFTVGAEYTKPVFEDYLFHTSFNTNYQSAYNNTDNLSQYGNMHARSFTDASAGLSFHKNIFDVSFIVKNLFNNATHEPGWNSFTPYNYPTWFGVQVSGKI